jgi:transcription elongation factor Elf1
MEQRMIPLVIKCSSCGKWYAFNTDNILKAISKCKYCDRSVQIKSKQGGWNADWYAVKPSEIQDEVVKKFNSPVNDNKDLNSFITYTKI